ncbi:MAG: AMP-binding protein [Oscillospiraceae bacterium]|nr:AMP-binding protein [Oscillospiraceae bacterium]
MSKACPENAQFFSCPEEVRLEKLNESLKRASTLPFWREKLEGLLPLENLASLSALPFSSEEDIIACGEKLTAVSATDIKRVVSLRTSGTSGRVKRIFFTENDIKLTRIFFSEGMAWLCGEGDKAAILMPGVSPDGLFDILSKSLLDIGVNVLPPVSSVSEAADLLSKENPDVIIGLPWYVRLLSVCLPELSPRYVLLSADYVPRSLKKQISENWECTVVEHYGMTETGYGFAVEYPKSGIMYPRNNDFCFEIINTDTFLPCKVGEEGEIVISSLGREAMPLVRYRTGDLGSFDYKNGFPVLIYAKGKKAFFPARAYEEALAPLSFLADFRFTDEGEMEALILGAEKPEYSDAVLSALSRAGLKLPEKIIFCNFHEEGKLFFASKRSM